MSDQHFKAKQELQNLARSWEGAGMSWSDIESLLLYFVTGNYESDRKAQESLAGHAVEALDAEIMESGAVRLPYQEDEAMLGPGQDEKS